MAGAAFFDLDRTLLAGGSGPHLSQAMHELGVIARRFPGEKYVYGLFDLLGENLPSMFLARQATWVAKGKAADAFAAAAERAAELILERVHPFAAQLIDQHKKAGRHVVLASTTPRHLIAPLAARLGFDEVLATTYEVDDAGTFTGGITGHFVWSRGKLAAVSEWAVEHGIDLSESYAYSDSIYDSPLLYAVGHPAAVNPDPRLTLLALAQRWPIVHFDVAPGVLKVPVLGWELQKIVQAVNLPELMPWARIDFRGVENIPRTGPAILVANHRSYFDLQVLMALMRRQGRTARALGKKELFDVPVLGSFLAALGGIPVDRGGRGKESFDMASVALEGGELVFLLPQGTIPRGADFFDPVLKGKTGAARLAALTGAPVIPIGIWGSELVWPRSATLPDVTRISNPPVVRVKVGSPVELKYRSAEADTRRIMSAISALLPAASRRRHTPSEEELRRTYPGGKLPGED